jgi:hypothetical protein
MSRVKNVCTEVRLVCAPPHPLRACPTTRIFQVPILTCFGIPGGDVGRRRTGKTRSSPHPCSMLVTYICPTQLLFFFFGSLVPGFCCCTVAPHKFLFDASWYWPFASTMNWSHQVNARSFRQYQEGELSPHAGIIVGAAAAHAFVHKLTGSTLVCTWGLTTRRLLEGCSADHKPQTRSANRCMRLWCVGFFLVPKHAPVPVQPKMKRKKRANLVK